MEMVLAAIADADAKASALAESDRPYLRLRFPEDGTKAVAQAAQRYADFLGGGAEQTALPPIRDAIVMARRALVSKPEGIGLEAAILVPLAFAAEFGAAVQLGSNNEELRTLIGEYRHWTGRMRSQINGAIPFRRQVAETAHDGQLSAVAQSHLGRRLGLSNFLMHGNQAESRIADPCVIIAKNVLSFDYDARGGITIPQPTPPGIPSSYTPNVLVGYSEIKVRDNSQFGVRLIRFSPGSGGNYAASNHFLLFPQIAGDYCYIARSEVELSTERAFAKGNELDGMKEDKANRAKIIVAVNNANACRIEIALSGRALGMVGNFSAILDFYERPL